MFEILSGSAFWVGMTTWAKWAGQWGWGMRGLVYGGNLGKIDGLIHGFVQSGWGPEVKQGDRVGMRLEVAKGRAILSFSHNGRGLGPAFNISGLDVSALRPVVSLTSGRKFKSIRSATAGAELSISKSSGGS